MLPGELSADAVLDGAYPYPPSPAVPVHEDWTGFAKERLGQVPPPGVHPRILISPDQLPDLRRRLKETEVGRTLYATMEGRIQGALHDPQNWGSQLYEKLAAGDVAGASAMIKEHGDLPKSIGHYKPWLYAVVLEALDAMIVEDEARGRRVATALATYAEIVRPTVDRALAAPMGDDVWRAKISGPQTGTAGSDQGIRDGMGGQLLGYGYDFAYNFMTDTQRATVRGLIAKATHGELWMGARLPHHFRNWNWIMVAMAQPLLVAGHRRRGGVRPSGVQDGFADHARLSDLRHQRARIFHRGGRLHAVWFGLGKSLHRGGGAARRQPAGAKPPPRHGGLVHSFPRTGPHALDESWRRRRFRPGRLDGGDVALLLSE